MKTLIICTLLLLPAISFGEDYHVLSASDDGRTLGVVFHLPIPAENNSAGISLRTVISEMIKPRLEDGTYGTFQSQLQNISAPELAQLRNGELYEWKTNVKFLTLDTNLQKQTKIDNKFTSLTTNGLNKLRQRLKFYGKSRNVP